MQQGRALSGKVAVVAGAASGIGRAAVAALAGAGARVLAVDCREPAPAVGEAGFLRADLRDAAEVAALHQRLLSGYGAPAVLVSSVGAGIAERLVEGDPEKWADAFERNVMANLRLIRSLVPSMLTAGGDVVLIGSVAAGRAYPYGGVYAASKAALATIADNLRLEVQPRVRVTLVAPGVVDTPFFDHMLSGQQSVEEIGFGSVSPEQIADAILYAVTRPPEMALNDLTIRPRAQPF